MFNGFEKRFWMDSACYYTYTLVYILVVKDNGAWIREIDTGMGRKEGKEKWMNG